MRELIARLLRRPTSRVVEPPVRDLVREALAERDLPSAAELVELKQELERSNLELQRLAERVEALDGTLSSLRAERDALLERLEAATRPEPEPEPEPAPEPEPEPERSCKVEGCTGPPKSRGFCRSHYTTWRRKGLDGFVGPEGLIAHGGGALRVAMKHQGAPVVVTGKKRLTVKVAGAKVEFSRLH